MKKLFLVNYDISLEEKGTFLEIGTDKLNVLLKVINDFKGLLSEEEINEEIEHVKCDEVGLFMIEEVRELDGYKVSVS